MTSTTEESTAAKLEKKRKSAREVAMYRRLAGPLPDSEHGLRTTYQRGCDCGDCKAANSAYRRARRQITGQ